ncbi:MAG: hypothetical protein U0324_27235 [Polyangiales bacterium]
MTTTTPPHSLVLGTAHPGLATRVGPRIRHFPGGKGDNNCPRFYYVRDGFGCIFDCAYCYLRRFDYNHPWGAEIDPDIDGLCAEVAHWLARSGRLGLILGEVTDAWGWAHLPLVPARNRRLIELFRAQSSHTLIFLTKSGKVHRFLDGVAPTPQVILSWSVNTPEVAALYEMGGEHAQSRLQDAIACREKGWRIRLRLDPMIPVAGWASHYAILAEQIARDVRPEQVTCGSWRPRPRDPMYRRAPADLRALLEAGPDGRLRLRNRLAMYEHVWSVLRGHVPELSLCKEELPVQAALYGAFSVTAQSCNCLGVATAPVTTAASRRRLPVVQGGDD